MDETRPLIISQAVSVSIGLAWLALVYFTPVPPPAIALIRPEEAAAVEVEFEDERPKPNQPEAPKPEDTAPTPEAKAEARAKREAQEAGDAFGGAAPAPVADITNALRGVEVGRGGGGAGAAGGAGTGGGKAVIAYGDGGAGSRTPGRGMDPSVAAAGEGIGRVGASGSVSRTNIAVSAPTVVRSADGGASGRDMARLGTFARGRQAQLQFCYRDVGLNVNPNLSGSVSVAITLDAAGRVSESRIANRTWSGAGVQETEACILSRVDSWAFPASSKAGAETYNFSFIFNK
ncbi:MAG: AgmX/PglI C-terminal domain-containing protein [Gemmatimonadetes bacterium]|nr:AgmX/PglI C-terminal domain-containing protein [Gemmatimonadota bacterium]